jgi:hypothetical protein
VESRTVFPFEVRAIPSPLLFFLVALRDGRKYRSSDPAFSFGTRPNPVPSTKTRETKAAKESHALRKEKQFDSPPLVVQIGDHRRNKEPELGHSILFVLSLAPVCTSPTAHMAL